MPKTRRLRNRIIATFKSKKVSDAECLCDCVLAIIESERLRAKADRRRMLKRLKDKEASKNRLAAAVFIVKDHRTASERVLSGGREALLDFQREQWEKIEKRYRSSLRALKITEQEVEASGLLAD